MIKKFTEFIESSDPSKTEIFKLLECSKTQARMLQYLANEWIQGDYKTIRARNLIEHAYKCKSTKNMEHINSVAKLLELGWIAIIRDKRDSDSVFKLYEKEIMLSDEFFELFESKNKRELKSGAYENQVDYILDEFNRVEHIVKISLGKRKKLRDANATQMLNKIESNIKERLKATKNKDNFGILKLFKEYKMDEKEKIILLSTLMIGWRSGSNGYFADGYGIDEDVLLNIISTSKYEIMLNKKYLSEESNLLKNEIIYYESDMNSYGEFVKKYYPETSTMQKILEGSKSKSGQKMTISQAIKEQDIFELVHPKNTLEDVILNPKTQETLHHLLAQVNLNVVNKLKLWGIKDKKSGIDAKILFFGPPGTGKTMSALGLAKSLKRSILSFDCSKILSMYVGESEKNVRAIFESYEDICKKTKNDPILLLDEADQFLSARGDASSSVDKMHNQMQNIFLERLEKFDGLLIATTNLLETFDSAFSRRFNYKIKFERPNIAQRELLWIKYFPANAPFDDDRISIAKKLSTFDLSGGQISLIIKNTAYKVAAQKDGIFSYDVFVEEIKNEQNSNFDGAKNVGFMR